MTWFVYVLTSKRIARTYVGIARDTDRRLRQHNGEEQGGARTTRAFRPWGVARTHGPFETRGEAARVEARLKRRRGVRRLDDL